MGTWQHHGLLLVDARLVSLAAARRSLVRWWRPSALLATRLLSKSESVHIGAARAFESVLSRFTLESTEDRFQVPLAHKTPRLGATCSFRVCT